MIFRYWKFAVGAAGMALLIYPLYTLRISMIKASHALEIENIRTSMTEQCDADKKITNEVENDLQDKITDLRNRLDKLNRLRVKVPVQPADTTRRSDEANGSGHAHRNGIDSETLYNYAGKAEEYRRQLNACQSFIKKVWEKNKGG